MCHFIVLIVRGGKAPTIDQVLRTHGRQARPLFNPFIASALEQSEAQFLTTVGHCDCGTALAGQIADRVNKRAQQAVKLAEKGWSKSKIERWLSDRAKADERAKNRRHSNAPDNTELWSHIIRDLMSAPDVQQAGLLVHYYSGGIEEEAIEPSRLTVPLRDLDASLQALREDQLLMAV